MWEGRVAEQLKTSVEDPIKFFKCSSQYPMCAFNFCKPHVIPEEFVFKAQPSLDTELIEDYFAPKKMLKRNNQAPIF